MRELDGRIEIHVAGKERMHNDCGREDPGDFIVFDLMVPFLDQLGGAIDDRFGSIN